MKSLFENSEYPLSHSGVAHDENPPGRGSGRYPWGSGKRPKQKEKAEKTKKKESNKFLLSSLLNNAMQNVAQQQIFDQHVSWAVNQAIFDSHHHMHMM